MPDATLAKTKNLLSRQGRYWARLSVPVALRPIITKRELLEPLGADRTQARRVEGGGRSHLALSAVACVASSQTLIRSRQGPARRKRQFISVDWSRDPRRLKIIRRRLRSPRRLPGAPRPWLPTEHDRTGRSRPGSSYECSRTTSPGRSTMARWCRESCTACPCRS